MESRFGFLRALPRTLKGSGSDMAEGLEAKLEEIANAVLDLCKNALKLTVETNYQPVSVGGNPVPQSNGARTEMKIDGDCTVLVPVETDGNNGIQVETDLWEIHKANVQAAADYRTKIITSLVEAIQKHL
jgi:hypothetical protein